MSKRDSPIPKSGQFPYYVDVTLKIKHIHDLIMHKINLCIFSIVYCILLHVEYLANKNQCLKKAFSLRSKTSTIFFILIIP